MTESTTKPESAATGSGRRRLIGVDATRGLALVGMMAVHVLPAAAVDGGATTSHAIAGGRSAATFAVLAGVGLALLTGGTRPLIGRRYGGAAAGLVVRAVAIGAVGLLLGLGDSGVAVILAYYAVLFVIAIPLLPLRAWALAATGITVAIVFPFLSHAWRGDTGLPFGGRNPTFGRLADSPGELLEGVLLTGYYPALAWTAYLCAGLAAGRLNLRRRRTAAWLFGGGGALAVAASATSSLLLGPLDGRDRIAATVTEPAELDNALELGLYGNTPTTTWWWLAVDAPHSSTPLDLLHTIGVALALLGALLLLASLGRPAAVVLAPVAAAGSMTLSLYTAHVLLLASDLLPDDRETSYVVQVVAALALALVWRRLVGRGPLEWLVAVMATPLRTAVGGPPTGDRPAAQPLGEPQVESPAGPEFVGASGVGMGQDHGQELLAALRLLLQASHSARADDLPALVRQAGYELGASVAFIYVVDYDQVQLGPLLESDPMAEEKLLMARGSLPVEGTIAGRSFTDVTVVSSSGAVGSGTGQSVWAPLLDGTDRLGVLELVFDEPVEVVASLTRDIEMLAAMLAELVMSRTLIGDFIERARRRLPMLLEAELQWNLLPPLTFASPRVSIAGALAPTHEVAGDSFDYAVNGDIAHLCIVDAMGHGLDATLMSAVAIGALRNARRSGLDLVDTARSMNKHIAAQFGESRFVTAIVGELDTRSGVWRWVNAGHPAALVVRGGRVVKTLDSLINPPLALQPEAPEVGEERLEPGDRLLLYTDGVIEARDADGEFFGISRLVDLVSREGASGRPAAETLRRLNLAILAHQAGLLQDDATTLMVEWSSADARTVRP